MNATRLFLRLSPHALPRIAMALTLALLLTPARVLAQSATPGSTAQPAQDNASQARATFERGVAAIQEGRFADAAVALEESYRLRPVPVVLNNLGIAYRGLGRNLEAIDAFERYLEAPGSNVDPAALAEVRSEIERLRRTLATLSVRCNVPNAQITIDGRARGTVGDVQLDPGPHTIEVRADGHRSERRDVRLEPSVRTPLEVTLSALDTRGRLEVDPNVLTAAVLIDGAQVGSGHTVIPLVGQHQLEVRANGYVTHYQTVRVDSEQRVRLDITLERGRSYGWVVPVALVGAGLIAGGILLGVMLSRRECTAIYEPALGNICEMGAR